MEFDVFDKLSELETKIHFLKLELEEKNALILALTNRNNELEQRLASINVNPIAQTVNKSDTVTRTIASTEIELETESDLMKIESGKSIAEALKEASDNAVRHTGYTFDEQTGLYYDHNSGYYYDPENQLFYEPRRGIYYSYNSETGEYTYQSSTNRSQLKEQYESIVSDPTYQHELKKKLRRSSELTDPVFAVSRRKSRSKESVSRHHHRRRRSRSSSHCTKRCRRRRSTSTHSSRSDQRTKYRHRYQRRRADSSDATSRSGSSRKRRNHRRRGRKSSSSSDGWVCRRRHSSTTRSRSGSGVSRDTKTLSVAAQPVHYPPVVRMLILTSDHASPGHVFILTSAESSKGWGCIGRSPNLCPSVNFPDDPAVSAIHCEIIFEHKDQRYVLIDRNSQSGTYINGQQVLKKSSVPVCHGDVLRVGSSRILIHIHNGQESCGQCDSETVKAAFDAATPSQQQTDGVHDENGDTSGTANLLSGSVSRETQRRATIDKLKEKYGLKQPASIPSSKGDTSYVDRAAQRRAIEANLKASGYEPAPPPGVTRRRNPRLVPLITASISTPISEDSRGAKLMSKMGWTPGEGLGKTSSGIAKPITVTRRLNPQAGLGSHEKSATKDLCLPIDATPQEILNAHRRAITRERYDQLE